MAVLRGRSDARLAFPQFVPNGSLGLTPVQPGSRCPWWPAIRHDLRTFGLASVTGLAPAAFVRGSDRRQIAAAIGGAGWYLALERERMKTATASIMPMLEAVVAAAAPLMRHSDAGIREATEHFMSAAFQYHESRRPEEVEAAAADFGTAVRAVLYSPARRRLSWRRRTQ